MMTTDERQASSILPTSLTLWSSWTLGCEVIDGGILRWLPAVV